MIQARLFVGLSVLVLATGAPGCLDDVQFHCKQDSQCVDQQAHGVCERSGFCSFRDPTCSSGRRYGAYAEIPWQSGCVQCGNGVVESTEECDDGNKIDTDGCLSNCKLARCGDGVVRAHVEECDDGNTAGDDACSPQCVSCAGGDDRFVWEGNGHCYTRMPQTTGWVAARDACARTGGALVTYNGRYENDAVFQRLVQGRAACYWTGLREESQVFAWHTGEPVLYANWPNGDPKTSGTDCGCQGQTSVAGSAPRIGLWEPMACTAALPSLCEARGAVVRPTDNHAYKAFFNPLTWGAARAACVANGGHLATPTDAEEDALLTAQFPGTFWLGGDDSAREGTFVWVTGERFAYQNFAPGEPDDMTGNDDCLALGPDRVWHDRPCTSLYNYICEIQ